MTIHSLGINQSRTAVILGAGASRGGSCFEGKQLKAPLDTDFFKLCQIVMHSAPELEELVTFVKEEFSPTLNLRMEEVFTAVEALNLFFDTVRVEKGPRVKRYEKILNKYSYFLCVLFTALSRRMDTSGVLTCKYHDKLCSFLDGNDTIISFNYDTIIDQSLKSIAKKKWNPSRGYGIEISTGKNFWSDHSGKGRIASEGISLLKLHGSLNWKRLRTGGIALREDSYEAEERDRNEIVPPVWNKRLASDRVLNAIWKNARLKLRGINSLVVIGYSLPVTDSLTQSLLKVSLAENQASLQNIIIINPDLMVSDRILGLVGPKLTSATQVYQYNSFQEWSNNV